jgi:aminopeptidase N
MSLVFEARPETASLVELLAVTAPGVQLTFGQLSAAAGVDDIRDRQHLLQSARRIAEREYGAVYCNERNEGYRRLTTEQIPHVEMRTAQHQRSVARATIQTLTRGVERANDVPRATQLRLNEALARQGIIARLTARRLLKAVVEPEAPLPTVPEIAQRLLDRTRLRRRSA